MVRVLLGLFLCSYDLWSAPTRNWIRGLGKNVVTSTRDVFYQQLNWEVSISWRCQQVSVRSRFHYCLFWAGTNHKTAAEFECSSSAQFCCRFMVWVYRDSSVLLCGGKFHCCCGTAVYYIHVWSELQGFLLHISLYIHTGSAKKCIHTLTKENSTLYNLLL